ncbi:tRNA threonylcarbamoyladenosine biosynthesis protein TsaE [Erysipelothrix larvae]|uniref:tRNA threonylcarbamoyladenosine biosynthesis protein TsaE n=1 Tax=Erysipelothrix larvae TaxID=1514105 RepID=A0A0X8GZ15_9FIRM|nr:tRNA (adenosine(37)-N6)-threonylcarbamoyltransferase complex ATPase subunit type 1 TsaE [Erysipelothrix larvae]AMC93053.1 tRNA threonylcarbamoyladenosine biosynthesis protein TsaE [Erysipelothrix larvae]
MKEYITHNLQETIELGKAFSSRLHTGCVIALTGELGVGKTAFTKGIALGLDIEDTISSPTFTLLKEYEGRLDLKHIDAYRLENVNADSLALYDLMDDNAVVVIEWSNFISDDIDYDFFVSIEEVDEITRKITLEGRKL